MPGFAKKRASELSVKAPTPDYLCQAFHIKAHSYKHLQPLAQPILNVTVPSWTNYWTVKEAGLGQY